MVSFGSRKNPTGVWLNFSENALILSRISIVVGSSVDLSEMTLVIGLDGRSTFLLDAASHFEVI